MKRQLCYGWPIEQQPSFPVLVMLGLFSKFNGDFTLFKEIRTSCLALCRSVFAIINGKIQLCLTRTPPKSPAVSIKDSRGQTDLAHTWPEVLPVCSLLGPTSQWLYDEISVLLLQGSSVLENRCTENCVVHPQTCMQHSSWGVQGLNEWRFTTPYPCAPEHLTEPSTEFCRFSLQAKQLHDLFVLKGKK